MSNYMAESFKAAVQNAIYLILCLLLNIQLMTNERLKPRVVHICASCVHRVPSGSGQSL